MFIRDISLVPWGIMGLTNITGGMGTMSQFRGGRRHGHRADHAPQWSTGQSWPVVVEMDGEGTPKWMVFVGKSQPQMDDLWVPMDWKAPFVGTPGGSWVYLVGLFLFSLFCHEIFGRTSPIHQSLFIRGITERSVAVC